MVRDDQTTRRTALKMLSGAAIASIGTVSGDTMSRTSGPDIPPISGDETLTCGSGNISADCGGGGGGGTTWENVGQDYVDGEAKSGLGLAEISTQVLHEYSEWSDSEEAWKHKMALCSVASQYGVEPGASLDAGGDELDRQPEDVGAESDAHGYMGQEFSINGSPTLFAVPWTQEDSYGVYPDGGSSSLAEDAIMPFLTAFISEAIPGSSFGFAAADVLNGSDSLPQDEVTTTSNGFQYQNELSLTGGITGCWDWCCHHHEMKLVDTDTTCPILDVDVSFKHDETWFGQKEHWIDLSIHPAIPYNWGQKPSGTLVADENTSYLDGQRTLNPEKMTQDQIDDLGIKENVKGEVITVDADGEARSPDYIMTNNPFVDVERR